MPLRRRRPLLRAAAVGGTAYMAGKAGARSANNAEQQEMAPPPAPPPAPAPAAAPATSEADRVSALRDLKELLDSGAINQAEFDSEKARLLHSGP